MSEQRSASVQFLRALLRAAEGVGVATPRVLSRARIPPRLVAAQDGRVSIDVARAVWSEVRRQSGNRVLGLHLAERLDVGALDLVDYAGRGSANLGMALERMVQHRRLLSDEGTFSFRVTGGRAHFFHQARGALPWMCELVLGLVVLRARQFSGVTWRPLAVSFMHPRPPGGSATDEEYHRIFDAPVAFDQPVNEVLFDRALLELPFLGAEPRLCADLDRHIDAALASLPPASSLVTEVWDALAEALVAGNASLDSVGERLKMNPRTLQRRLAGQGTSHRQLLEHLRFQLARAQLDARSPQRQVAAALGYANPSGFHRAYRRWAGVAPGQHRR